MNYKKHFSKSEKINTLLLNTHDNDSQIQGKNRADAWAFVQSHYAVFSWADVCLLIVLIVVSAIVAILLQLCLHVRKYILTGNLILV